MNKNKELIKNTAIISIGKICTQFLSFLLLPLYTSLLTTKEYGAIDLITTYQQLLGYIVFFQIEQAVFRFLIDVRKDKDSQKTIVSSVIFFAFFQTILLCITLFVLSKLINFNYLKELCLYCIATVYSGLMLQIARGLGRNSLYALGSFISAISTICFNVLFLVVFKFGANGMLYSFILGNALCAIFILVKAKVYRYIDIGCFSKESVIRCLKYSLPLVPNALSWWVMGASDRSIVSYAMGAAANGLLSVSHKFSSAYTTFYTVFNLSWTESASLHFKDDDREIFFESVISRVYKLFSAACIGIIAVMPFVFPILINVNYGDAYYQIPIYMIAAFFNVVQGLYSVIYVALKKTKEIAKTTIVSALVNVAVNILLIKYIGLYAASISSLVAYAVNCIWRYFDLKKYMNVPLSKGLVISTLVMFIIVCVPYYAKCFVGQMIGIIIAVLYAVFINRDMILAILKSPRELKSHFLQKNK